ncbi:hypothetical protein E1B28_009461 [Marasmius oreades]|uniref:Uncharacterized protein n=1 Tax=Marasmius oreades TaxID=181124 RepID=A0A9P7RV39_9AGAR|nr:uncharacterized protein E1B28_009461 [Marasmius oreades]KAG7090341.1 hypothetical protein E1B28_009461 [Marasmius oreades]
MFNLKSALLVFTTLLISATAEQVALAAATDVTLPSPNAKSIVPIDPVGDVVAVQGGLNKPTLIIYQHRLGHLVSVHVKGAFSTGSTNTETIVPAKNVLHGTPLAVAQRSRTDKDPLGVVSNILPYISTSY